MTANNAGAKPAAPPSRRCGPTAVTVFLLAVFGVALLCIGLGLTWLAPSR